MRLATPLLLLALLSASPAAAQHPGLFGGTPITASSGNVGNASAVATIAAVAGKTAYLCGFSITSSGSTGALVVTATITGVVGGTLSYTYVTVAGVTLANPSLVVNLSVCEPATAQNTAIVLTLPALGAGNTNATVTAKGYYF